jgi:hypothetical protein
MGTPFPAKQERKISASMAEADPEVIRIEIMSNNDYFFQYVYK